MSEIHIVTGSTGRTGYALCLELLSRGLHVRALHRNGNGLAKRLQSAGCETVVCDVTNREQLDEAFKGATYVYHLAGVISIESKPSEAINAVNIGGTQNVIDMCLKHNIKRLVHTGSVHMLEVPKSKMQIITEPLRYSPDKLSGAYAKSKATAGNMVLDAVEKGLDAIIAMPSGIIGPYEFTNSNFGEMVEMVANNKLRIAINGKYDFVDVRDVAFALAELATKGEKGMSYIVSGNIVNVKGLVNIVAKAAGRKKIRFTVPMFIVKMFAKGAENRALKKGVKPTFTPYSMQVLQDNCNFSHARLTSLTGYSPRSAEVSLADHVAFLAERKNS